MEKEKFLVVEVTEEELAMLAKMRERAKEQQKPQEEKTFTFTIRVDNEIMGTIKVNKKQNELLDWLFNNGCFHDGVDFEDGYPELVDFTK